MVIRIIGPRLRILSSACAVGYLILAENINVDKVTRLSSIIDQVVVLGLCNWGLTYKLTIFHRSPSSFYPLTLPFYYHLTLQPYTHPLYRVLHGLSPLSLLYLHFLTIAYYPSLFCVFLVELSWGPRASPEFVHRLL